MAEQRSYVMCDTCLYALVKSKPLHNANGFANDTMRNVDRESYTS